jgi:hypothetical protein
VDISRQKGYLLSKCGENRRRNKLGVDRHGDWQEQVSPVIILVLFSCYLFCFGGLRFKVIVLHLQSNAELLECYLCLALDILEMGSPKVFFLADLDCHPDQSPKYLGLQKGSLWSFFDCTGI